MECMNILITGGCGYIGADFINIYFKEFTMWIFNRYSISICFMLSIIIMKI